ncbi:hypothetical protein KDK_35800 [Dictyobacter kobayashii]|uniref:Uncharacterized protein n=1 Tax=Dictyobacter kobayashii TaxID=2014872 RepID=A0A402AL97_9CHLR|nr:hypothetical protein KDK_35800 [Dictyobacter kobayashii]
MMTLSANIASGAVDPTAPTDGAVPVAAGQIAGKAPQGDGKAESAEAIGAPL